MLSDLASYDKMIGDKQKRVMTALSYSRITSVPRGTSVCLGWHKNVKNGRLCAYALAYISTIYHMTSGQSIRLGYTTINLKGHCHLHYCYSECYCCLFCHKYSVLISALAQTYVEDQCENYKYFTEVILPKHLRTQHHSGYLTETEEQTTD
jgi:hypothetical protein